MSSRDARRLNSRIFRVLQGWIREGFSVDHITKEIIGRGIKTGQDIKSMSSKGIGITQGIVQVRIDTFGKD